jgi:hypothetical protein
MAMEWRAVCARIERVFQINRRNVSQAEHPDLFPEGTKMAVRKAKPTPDASNPRGRTSGVGGQSGHSLPSNGAAESQSADGDEGAVLGGATEPSSVDSDTHSSSDWTTDDEGLDDPEPSVDGSSAAICNADMQHTSSHGAAESQAVDDEMLDYQEALLDDLMSSNGAVGSQSAGGVRGEDSNTLAAGSAGDSEPDSESSGLKSIIFFPEQTSEKDGLST